MVKAADSLRVVFFGTPNFAVPTLQEIHASRHLIVAVVTQPDRGRGRGQKSQPGAVKQFALEHGLKILQPERLRDDLFLESLRALSADLGVVAAYGRILTRRCAGHSKAGPHQRSCIAAAEVPRCRADSSGGDGW